MLLERSGINTDLIAMERLVKDVAGFLKGKNKKLTLTS
jgi:hypothetical protein